MGQIKFMASILMTMIFVLAIMSFAVNFGDDNEVYVDVGDDTDITSTQTGIQTDLQTFKRESNSSIKALFESKIESGDETTATGGVFKGQVSGMFGSLKSIFTTIYKVIFGSEQGSAGFGIVLTAILSFMTVVLGLYIWKTWAGKSPD